MADAQRDEYGVPNSLSDCGSVLDLIMLLERAQGIPRGPRCGHCLRTMQVVTIAGKKFLHCQHCAEMENEKDPLYFKTGE